METMISVTFSEDSKAYEAMTNLKELDGQDQIDLTSAAVVVRGDDGHIEIKDSVGDENLEGTATGGLIGLLIGILGGPFGVLLGGATGVLLGSLYDMADDDQTESALEQLSRSVTVGHTTLLAQVDEQSPEVLDTAMKRLDGTIVRQSYEDVEAEIAAAEDAQGEAKRAARKALHEKRRAQAKERIQAKIEELKAKLHGHHPVGAGKS